MSLGFLYTADFGFFCRETKNLVISLRCLSRSSLRCLSRKSGSQHQLRIKTLPSIYSVAPYCTPPRDYLGDTRMSRDMGFGCLDMKRDWVRRPPLLSPKKDCRPEIDFPNKLEITLTRRYPKLIFRIKSRRNYPEMPPPNAWALTQITRNRLRELIKDYPYPGLPGINFLN